MNTKIGFGPYQTCRNRGSVCVCVAVVGGVCREWVGSGRVV